MKIDVHIFCRVIFFKKNNILSVGLHENFTEQKNKYIWKEALCALNPLSHISADRNRHTHTTTLWL